MSESRVKQTREFQAETKQLLDLMIHSIYINKEIFLRELISNASDAIDKARFQSLTNQDLLEGDSDFHIYIDVDEKSRTITISDNGIGMTYDEVVENIGTIAKSGTKFFLEKLQQQDANKDNVALIGQFGVGFYSAFMVADKVTLITRASGQEKAVRWESTGDGTYTIEETEKDKRGTKIILSLPEVKKDADKQEEDFVNRYTIQSLVKKYSDYIRYPIKMDFRHEEKPKDEEGKIIEDASPTITVETKTLNSMVPLWSRNKKDISAEEYKEFYKNTFHDWEEPLEIIHTKVEGAVEYTALLFIPAKAPFNFYMQEYENGIKLYSKNVYIMDKCEELLPEYLGFVRGLIDSPDFSLNISREILQNSRQLKLIGKNIEKSILKTLTNLLSNDRKKYEGFWQEFGKAIKAGIYKSGLAMDSQTKEKLQDLVLFNSSNSNEGLTTFEEYVSRMSEKQEDIYYVTGKDRTAVENLPQLELLREKGIEVLYLFDKIDEFAIEVMREYKGKKFKSASRGDLKLDDTEEKSKEELNKENEGMLKAIKEALGDKVADVKLSHRLKSSAVCLVSSDAGISFSMEQILSEMGQTILKASRVLEINPSHDVFQTLKKLYNTKESTEELKEYSELLYAQAMLVEGFTLENPADFANRIASLMVKAAK